MAKWIEYTGSDEQIEEMQKSEHGFICINNSGIRSSIIKAGFKMAYISPNGKHEFLCLLIELKKYLDSENTNSYLICDPHPYADLIDIWRLSGCPVYWKSKSGGGSGICHEYFPPFAHPNEFEYRLTPFED